MGHSNTAMASVVFDALNSLPSPLNKAALAGGWAWASYFAVKAIKAAIPVDKDEEVANTLFDDLDTNKSGDVDQAEFEAAFDKPDEFPKLCTIGKKAFEGFIKQIAQEEPKGAFNREQFVKYWKSHKKALMESLGAL